MLNDAGTKMAEAMTRLLPSGFGTSDASLFTSLTRWRHAYTHAYMTATSCIGSKVRCSSRTLASFYDQAPAPVSPNTARFSLLRTVRRLGSSGIFALAEATTHCRSRPSRTLRALERAGRVLFEAGGDSRERLIRLSAAAEDVVAATMPRQPAAQNRVNRMPGPEHAFLFSLPDRVEALRA